MQSRRKGFRPAVEGIIVKREKVKTRHRRKTGVVKNGARHREVTQHACGRRRGRQRQT